MLKKIVSGMLAAGMMLASVSAFACDCGSEYKKTYEYPYIGNDKHRCWCYRGNESFNLSNTYALYSFSYVLLRLKDSFPR